MEQDQINHIKQNTNNRPQRDRQLNNRKNNRPATSGPLKSSRSRAIQASRRSQDDANKAITNFNVVEGKLKNDSAGPIKKDTLRILFLGGMNGIGTHNFTVIEYNDDAIVIDCGMDLTLGALPGVNFGVSDIDYLLKIKNKVRGYVFTHAHLDHVGAVPHVLPKVPAKVYGSAFTCGFIEERFKDDHFHLRDQEYIPECVPMNMDNHERLIVGPFTIELIRVTHSTPDSSMVVIDTPVGRLIHTGDFRLDPEPLDKRPTDMERLRSLANDDKKVLVLMEEATYAQAPGRVPTESTLQTSFSEIMDKTHGRIYAASFSSNMNRVQMIVEEAYKHGRKVCITGRSMLNYLELSVKLGLVKIPAGSIIPVREALNVPDDQLVIITTGGQGEANAGLTRMSTGEHRDFKLKAGDTVILSSTPVPGNEVSMEKLEDDLTRMGVKLFTARNHEVDGSGPLHVSGHARRDELAEVIELLKPKYLIPMYAGPRHRKYLAELALENGMPASNIFLIEDGEVLEFTEDEAAKRSGKVHSGTVLIDETGMIVPSLVVKDRLIMKQDGIVSIVLTIDKRSRRLISSPDIITRGFIYIKENEDLMNGLRDHLRKMTAERYGRSTLDEFKYELKDFVTHYLYEHTNRSPIVIPVVNVIGGNSNDPKKKPAPKPDCDH
ncbi:MAG: ribonuclease J [Candidatus Nomurabacteria bacterium]|nr:MAG: ribonuclease J [Candidatus Nomurabacteria bacterium]